MRTTGHKNPLRMTGLAVGGCVLAVVAGLAGKSLLETEPEIAALLEKLEPVPVESVPPSGTFWLLKRAEPPWPVLPPIALEFSLPVYPVDDKGTFIVDDRAVDYVALAELESALRTVEREFGLLGTTDSGPPLPGEDEEEGEGGGVEPSGWGYPSNALWLELVAVTNQAGAFVVHSPEADGVYDLFGTTNLSPYVAGFNLTNWFWVLRTAPGQTNLVVTNLAATECYFRLAGTNDTDGGGFSDAFERLVTHTDPNNPADDRLVPLVSIRVLDSVAVEQYPSNTARFELRRLGGHVSWPLQVQCGLSGSATYATDYSLGPATVIGTNVTVSFAPGQIAVELTLTPVPDSQTEGTETATLTLRESAEYEVDSLHSAVTGWILEQYQYTYTTVADFRRGTMMGLEAVQGSGDGQLQFTSNLPPQFPFIAVACSGRGTVARINTTNGTVIGEYRTTPAGLTYSGDSGPGPQPSRTTVDLFGNVWVANRADDLKIGGTNYGSITRIGLIIGGSRFDKIGTNYVPNPRGQYVALSNAIYNTCIDRDGDGFIRTSTGLADILPWNNGGGVDSAGGVSTAEDEAITEYVRVPTTGTRTIAVDKFNDIWVGGRRDGSHPHNHLKVNGLTATVVPGSVFTPTNENGTAFGGYGGVIDRLGCLWSSDNSGDTLLWLRPPTNYPPQPNVDWKLLTTPGVNMYGIAVDPLHPYIWQSSGDLNNYVFRWRTNGVPVTNQYGQTVTHYHGASKSQGLVVDSLGHVWVAHGKGSGMSIGHLDTNGTWLGNVGLHINGLWAEYFPNTNLAGLPVLTNWENTIDFAWTNGWPESPPVPTNYFSARWSGIVVPRTNGMHVFHVSAEPGAAVQLRVNGTVIIDNWAAPGPAPIELAGTNWLGTNVAYDIRLEYAHRLADQPPRIRLMWQKPGGPDPEVIPWDGFYWSETGPTGLSVDSTGKIWAGCYDANAAIRIDPNAGPIVLTTNAGVIVTNHVGLVDMVVELGDGTWHQAPYDQPAQPYNYSDMTGFNNRIVNPTLQPLKGYWIAVHDSGIEHQLWNKVRWTASVPDGCAVEVFVRAADDRTDLGRASFVQVTNDVFFPSIRGRYIEVRLALIRDDPAKQPVLYELTLYGTSSGFAGDLFLYGGWAEEGEDAVFWTELEGAEPLCYQWFRQWPWETSLTEVTGATNGYFVITNVDSWVDGYVDENGVFHGTLVSCHVSNGNGESVWLGPEYLVVEPVRVEIPATNYPSHQGPATRYPMKINVFGMPTNFYRVSVTVTLRSLNHSRSADMSILLVSPSGKQVMLMSNVGGTNSVSNGSLVFQAGWLPPDQAEPLQPPGPSPWPRYLGPSNYGQVEQMPQVGPDPPPAHTGVYSANLLDLEYDNPNGLWKLYIHDDVAGAKGHLDSSWGLQFKFE